MEDRLVLQDRLEKLAVTGRDGQGTMNSFNISEQRSMFQLAKISPHNYIMHLSEALTSQQSNSPLLITESQRKLN
jgi:hypothetical protein